MDRAGIGDRVEGLHAVSAAVAAGRVERLVVERSRLGRPEVADLVDRCRAGSVVIEEVGDLRALSVTAAPQGVMAEGRPVPLRDLEELVSPSPAAVVVLDHLEDPHNVGAIARSALASSMTGMVVSSRRAAPLGPTAFKSAAGALEHLPVSMVSSVDQALRTLGDLGLWSVGLTRDGDQELFGLGILTEPVALVVGGEGSGLSRLVEERLEVRARIPMREGSTESLNASVAAALGMFEIARMRAR